MAKEEHRRHAPRPHDLHQGRNVVQGKPHPFDPTFKPKGCATCGPTPARPMPALPQVPKFSAPKTFEESKTQARAMGKAMIERSRIIADWRRGV